MKPIQTLSWKEKIANKKEWFHKNADYFIGRSRFGMNSEYQVKMQTLYDVYNNRYPAKWFNHITNPLNSDKYNKFPAKMRPVNILRTNLDYLMNEFGLRPFEYHVTNLDPDAVNAFETALNEKLNGQIQQTFANMLLTQNPEMDPSEVPDLSKERQEFYASYRDKIAINGQQWLEKTLPVIRAEAEWNRMFKDWVIAGEAHSYKGFIGNKLIYERVSPLDIDYDMSEDKYLTEDSEWVVRRKRMNISDIVDYFYDKINFEDLESQEGKPFINPVGMYSWLAGGAEPVGKGAHNRDTRFVYHVQWKGKKKVAIVKEIDPLNGSILEIEYDEDHPFTEEQKKNLSWITLNEVHECWKLADGLYVQEGCPPIQRNEINNISSCKMNYNGRRFSDTHSENIAPSEIGVPYQIMYMIINRTLELTVAKSKGKILLLDKNTIPDDEDWDEDKFFYYSEAMGYALLDRNKIGADRSWNQYQVVDMTLFESIKQLIDLQNHYKQEWDDIIGIPRQKRGSMMASDGKATTEHSLNQSSVVTDGIYRPFEEFQETELQGLLDFSKFDVAIGNGKSLYYNDMAEAVLMNIDPEPYSNASLGVMCQKAGKAVRDLGILKQAAMGKLQDGNTKFSTVASVLTETNLHRLKAGLKQVEAIEAQMAKQNEELQQQFELELLEREKAIKEFESALRIEEMHEEFDRKEDLEMIKGAFNTFTFQDGDSNDNNIPDAVEVGKLALGQGKLQIEDKKIQQQSMDAAEQRRHDQRIQDKELAQREKESVRKERSDRLKAKAAAAKAKVTKSKPKK